VEIGSAGGKVRVFGLGYGYGMLSHVEGEEDKDIVGPEYSSGTFS
jgi:hypothetical protein